MAAFKAAIQRRAVLRANNFYRSQTLAKWVAGLSPAMVRAEETQGDNAEHSWRVPAGNAIRDGKCLR